MKVWIVHRSGDPSTYFEGVFISLEAVKTHYPSFRWNRKSSVLAVYTDFENENYWTASLELVKV
jgi:hypothetical protein